MSRLFSDDPAYFKWHDLVPHERPGRKPPDIFSALPIFSSSLLSSISLLFSRSSQLFLPDSHLLLYGGNRYQLLNEFGFKWEYLSLKKWLLRLTWRTCRTCPRGFIPDCRLHAGTGCQCSTHWTGTISRSKIKTFRNGQLSFVQTAATDGDITRPRVTPVRP